MTYKKLDTVLCFSQPYGGAVTVSLRSQTRLDKIYSVSELVKKRLEPILDRAKNFYAQNKDLFSKMDRVLAFGSEAPPSVSSWLSKLEGAEPLKVFTDVQVELDNLSLQYADALDIISRIPVYNQDQAIIKRIVDLAEELEYHRSNAANPKLNLKAA